jgi:hypothetical protein
MSGLVLAWRAGDTEKRGWLQKEGVYFLPNTYNTFLLSSEIYLFFEIYGLAYDPEGLTRYQMTVTLEEERGERHTGLDWLANKIFSREPKPVRVTSDFEYTGRLSRESVCQNLVLQNPRPGDYRIIVEIKDRVTGIAVRREKRFGLREPSGKL